MEVLEHLAVGLTTVLSPLNLALLGLGVLVGMVIGVMPGLGPSAGIAILLPLTFGLEPTSAIVMLAAIYYGAMYGGTITSVLINTPGESATVASTFDGYPLARKGRAGPALVMAAAASFLAGTIGAVLISVSAPLLAGITSHFGPPELFLLVLAGLLTLVVVIGRNRLLGALSALLGFAIATVGVDIGGGEQRYTFGSPELINGVDFVPVAIGLFGLGEIFHALYRGGHLEQVGYFSLRARGRDFWPNRTDVRESWAPAVRGSFLGFLVGTAPGAGATVASLMSYSLEKSVSKTPERFGKGAMPGLVGPEAANNAASAGAMVPLLTLGIPGSASTAVLLGGFLMWGLQPGPLLMEDNPEFAWGLVARAWFCSTYGRICLLVAGERRAVVAGRGGQFAGQHVGADQGQAGALPGQRRGAVAGVAEQRHPAARPAVHVDLADRVEVEVRRVPMASSSRGDLPAARRRRLSARSFCWRATSRWS